MPKKPLIAILLSCFLLLAWAPVSGQLASKKKVTRPTAFWPEGVEFDDVITPPKEYLGFEIGQRHLDHSKLVGYLSCLAEESDRIQLEQYGSTHGHRPLLLLTISAPGNLADIVSIKKRHRQLANPDRADRVDVANLPAVINMGYGVHGDEASATNCSALVAYYLAAAKGKEIEKWLADCVILLDPSLNPDGFNRFANWVNGYRGVRPNSDPQHREHNQGWPSGRVNYYWFDLNRDWLPLEHPESRARMKWYHSWKPNVVLDFHEMGTNSTYFFQPGIPNRTNPFTPAKNMELTARFGKYHGEALDQKGSLYFTQELFDDFYMGKGSTYPDLHGAVGILFEQASARGHVQKNQDGRLTFHSAIANHFTTSLSSLRATSDMREELLEYKRTFYGDSLKSAKESSKSAFVFSSTGNHNRLQKFADVLLRHDIQCFWPKADLELDGKLLKKGRNLLVPVLQPEYRFLKSLLMRRKNFKENIFYDVSSWTLPLAYDVSQSSIESALNMDQFVPVRLEERVRSRFKSDKSAVAYLVDWRDDASCGLLNRMLVKDVNVKVATSPFTAVVSPSGQTKSFKQGTLVVQLGVQSERRKAIEKLLHDGARNGVSIHVAYSGLTPEGVDVGSSKFRRLSEPAIAMPVGSGIAQYEAGEIWHLLDHKHGVQLSMLNVDRFASYDLRAYSTFVFPTGSYRRWAKKDWDAIGTEIRRGATAIAIGSTCELIEQKLSGIGNEPDANRPNDIQLKPQLPFDSAAKTRALKLVSGAIFKTRIDRTHPLFYGFPNDRLAVFRNHAKFLEPSKNPYCNPGIYDPAQPHVAGYCSVENVEKFKRSASVVVVPLGKGRLIQISDNPNFRAFWHGSSRVFLNAIFFGEFTNPRN